MITKETALSPGAKRQYVLPLNNPAVVSVAEATHMRTDDVVACILINGQARAYPWWIISNYHVINDTIMSRRPDKVPTGSPSWDTLLQTDRRTDRVPVPVLLVICEACTGTSAFFPIAEGYDRPLSFTFCERTAKSYSARGIYTIADIQTQSRWHPLMGVSQEGAFDGKRMHRIPVHTYKWSDWVDEFPEGEVVLASEEMRRRAHVADLPHPLDREAGHTDMIKAIWEGDEGLDCRMPVGELILGLSDGQDSIAVSHTYLALTGDVKNTHWKGTPVVLVRYGKYSAVAYLRVHNGKTLEFRRAEDGVRGVLDQFERCWSAFGTCLSDPEVPDLEIYQGSYSTKWGDWCFANENSEIVTEYNIADSNCGLD